MSRSFGHLPPYPRPDDPDWWAKVRARKDAADRHGQIAIAIAVATFTISIALSIIAVVIR